MFLVYDWLVKHNPEVNWNKGTIQFTKYLREYKTQHQNIYFILRTRKLQLMKNIDDETRKLVISKKPDPIILEDLPEYILPFTHLFNKKKFEKLPEQRKWNHEINLLKNTSKKLNANAYIMTVNKDKVLNQWLEEQLKIELIVESSSRYIAPCFYIPKKNRSL